MLLGRIGQVEITVSPYLVLLFALWLLAGLPLQSLILFIVVLAHELVHAGAAWLYGLKVQRVELYPFGGLARLKDPPDWYPEKEIVVALAGPLFNFLLSGLLFFFIPEKLPLQFQPQVLFFARANLALACFNLLPALPLDGGRIYRAILTIRKDHRRATEGATRLGKFFGALLFVAGLLLSSNDYLYLTVSLMGLFLYNAAHREREKAVYAFLRYLSRKEKELQKKGVMVGRELVAFEDTTLSQVMSAFRPQHYHLIWVLDRSCHVRGRISEAEVLENAWKKGINLPLKNISG